VRDDQAVASGSLLLGVVIQCRDEKGAAALAVLPAAVSAESFRDQVVGAASAIYMQHLLLVTLKLGSRSH